MAGTINHAALASLASLHNARVDLIIGPPGGAPLYVGECRFDRVNYRLYVAVGTTAGDWVTASIPDAISVSDTSTINLTLNNGGLLTADVILEALSITASQVTDFDDEVANNTDVAQNTLKRHEAVTIPASHAPTSVYNGLELDFVAQTLKLSQDLSTAGNPTFQGARLSTFGTGLVHSNGSGTLSSSLLVDADVSASAAIAGTKVSPDFGSQTVQTSGSVLAQTFNVQSGQEVVTLFPDAKTIQIGQSNTAKLIQIGGPNDVVQIQGTSVVDQATNLATKDKTLTVNLGGLSGSSGESGIYVEEASASLLASTAATWQSGNRIRLAMVSTGAIAAGSLVNVLGFAQAVNNGTFPVVIVSNNAYVEIENDARSDGSDDETGAAATVSDPVSDQGYARVSGDRLSWELKPSGASGRTVFTPGGATLTISQSLAATDSPTFSALTLTNTGTSLTAAGDANVQGNTILGASNANTLTLNAKVASDVSLNAGYSVFLSNTGRLDAPLTLNLGTVNATAINLGGAGTSVVLASLATGVVKSASGTLSSSLLVDADVSPSAAIAYSKLALSLSVVNGDVSPSAAIAYSKLNLTSSLVNADVAPSAAIAYSKLALSSSIVNADVSSSAAIAYSKLALSSSIVNADVSASAAISYGKLALSNSIVNADVSSSAAIAYSKLALTGSLVNSDVSASAAIAYSKLALASSIVDADVSASAAIAYSKLALTGSIVNADVSGSAAIAGSKIVPTFGAQNVSTTGSISAGSLTVTGAQYVAVSSIKTASYTVGVSDYLIRTDTVGGTITVTLPDAVSNSGRVLLVKDTSASWALNPLTLATAGGLVDGAGSAVIDGERQSVTLVSDGTDWMLV